MPKVYTEKQWEQSLETQFWDSITAEREPDKCWEWIGLKTNGGHPILRKERTVNGRKTIYAHRFVYELNIGPIPDGCWMDHICGNRSCVNPDHLRLCTPAQNAYNRKRGINNTSGYKGVSFWAQAQKWAARIGYRGSYIFLGYFDTKEEAFNTYCDAAKRLHGEFVNTGGAA